MSEHSYTCDKGIGRSANKHRTHGFLESARCCKNSDEAKILSRLIKIKYFLLVNFEINSANPHTHRQGIAGLWEFRLTSSSYPDRRLGPIKTRRGLSTIIVEIKSVR